MSATLAAGQPLTHRGVLPEAGGRTSDQPLGRIGPNAVIQLANALSAVEPGLAERVFAHAGLAHVLPDMPTEMVDEAIPQALFAALFEILDPADADAIAADAGRRTADYVIANRIPRIARVVLPILPQRLATRMLLRAIQRSAWTFVGSGECCVAARPPSITIVSNPLSMPGNAWHSAVFGRLFSVLIAPGAAVTQTEVLEAGHCNCRFVVELKASEDAR